MNRNKYILTSADLLDLALALKNIAMHLEDDELDKVRKYLDTIEFVLASAEVQTSDK